MSCQHVPALPCPAVAPTVMLLEFVMLGKSRSRLMVASVVVVCMGVTYATITDSVVVQNLTGLTVGLLSTLVTALYQLLAGSKQKDLKANSSQLLLSYTPQVGNVWSVWVGVGIILFRNGQKAFGRA